MPKRIQITRKHPWRKDHPDAVIVDRSGLYGNHYALVNLRPSWTIRFPDGKCYGHYWTKEAAAHRAVKLFRPIAEAMDLEPLRGCDLACWCEPPHPCHADLLIELANS